MQNLLNKFNGKSFKYCSKMYAVKNTKIVNQKAVILTDGQSFVKTESELEAFMDDIEFIKVASEKSIEKISYVNGGMTPMAAWKPEKQVNEALEVLNTEIKHAETAAQKLSNKLMEVFEALSDNPTEDTYKKATAMVGVSNSIINVQMAQIKFLSLKK